MWFDPSGWHLSNSVGLFLEFKCKRFKSQSCCLFSWLRFFNCGFPLSKMQIGHGQLFPNFVYLLPIHVPPPHLLWHCPRIASAVQLTNQMVSFCICYVMLHNTERTYIVLTSYGIFHWNHAVIFLTWSTIYSLWQITLKITEKCETHWISYNEHCLKYRNIGWFSFNWC